MQIEIGPMCPPLSQQLKSIGVPYDTTRLWDKLSDGINDAYVYGILTEAEWKRSADRLIKRINESIQKIRINQLHQNEKSGDS